VSAIIAWLGAIGSITDRILSLPAWLVIGLVFALPALEASAFLGFVFPGEIAVILGGVVASQGRVPLWAAIAAAISGAIIGDSIGYVIGRRWGDHLLHGTIGRLPIIREDLDKHLDAARAYVRRRKGRAVFFGRFTAALRVLVPGLAGMSGVHYPSFLAYNAAGGVLWGTGFAVLGYLAGASYKHVEKIAGRLGLVLLALVLVGLVASRLLRRLGEGSSRARALGGRLAASPPIAWVRRRFPRQVRWARDRVDAGSPYGFWLTFTVALGALAAWAFAGLTQDVVGHDEAALVDPRVSTWVVSHRTDWLTSVMKVVTWLGSTAVIIPALVLVAVALVVRRRDWRSVALLATAVSGAVALCDIVKPLVRRARPPAAQWIGHYGGAAFPSGRATQSIAFYGILAVVLSVGRPLRARTLLWIGATIATLAVGVSVIYLGAQWLTDVLGGFALGATWLAFLVALIMLLRKRERHAGRFRPTPSKRGPESQNASARPSMTRSRPDLLSYERRRGGGGVERTMSRRTLNSGCTRSDAFIDRPGRYGRTGAPWTSRPTDRKTFLKPEGWCSSSRTRPSSGRRSENSSRRKDFA
jgi:membrane protein DedA with SNARE-associated domain